MTFYDDTLRNLMSLLEKDSPAARTTLFRHLADLILQDRPIAHGSHRGGVMALIERILPQVEVEARGEIAELICAMSSPPVELALLLAGDALPVARWILDRATLPETAWLRLVPHLPGTHLAHLAKRKNLSPKVREAVFEALEPPEMALAASAEARGSAQIQNLLGKLKRFGEAVRQPAPPAPASFAAASADGLPAGRAAHLFSPEVRQAAPSAQAAEPSMATAALAAEQPRPAAPPKHAALAGLGADALWQTDRFAILTEWTADPRTPGMQAAKMPGEALDVVFSLPQAARQRIAARRAFRTEASLAGERFELCGVPVFETDSGVYRGFRGVLRHLGPAAEKAAPPADDAPPLKKSSERDAAELAHEMRTPINAIKGFAELIEGETWGPVISAYRDRSARIVAEAARIESLVSDLLDAGRLDAGKLHYACESVDVGEMAMKVRDTLPASKRGRVAITRDEPLPKAKADPRFLEGCLAKLIRGAAHWTPASRQVTLSLAAGEKDTVRIAAALPLWRGGLGAAALADVMNGAALMPHPLLATPLGYGLGLDFAMRLAALCGGQLGVVSDSARTAQLLLILPAASQNGQPH